MTERPIKKTFEELDMVKGKGDSKAFEINPYDLENLNMGKDYSVKGDTHRGTQGGFSYQTIKQLARMPLISAIIQTRVNQIAEFARPQPDRYSAGFTIRLRDEKTEITEEHQEEIAALTEWLLQCGDPSIIGFTTFETFLRQIARDSLVYDQCNFEVVYGGGRPVAFKPVDASTIRRSAPTEKEVKEGKRNPNKSAFVQVLDHKIVAEFKSEEMAWGIRRPRTEIGVHGYGFPEIEECAPTIIDMVHAKAYNSANFTHGLHLSGILAVKSKMSPALFRAFRREFYSMLQGPNGAKKTPIIQLDPESKEEVQSVNLSNSNSDMEYDKWLNFLIKEVCAIYQMDPAELGFVYGNEGQNSSLNQSGPGQRIQYSKEKGLRPFLRALETWINRWIIRPIAPHLEISFVGLDVESEDKRIDTISKKTKSFMTVNEARQAFDLEPLDIPAGDMILDSSWMNIASQQMQGGGGEEGEPQEQEGEEEDIGLYMEDDEYDQEDSFELDEEID